MSGFTPYELYRVLIACGFTQVEIVQRNGPSERSLVTIGSIRIGSRIRSEFSTGSPLKWEHFLGQVRLGRGSGAW
jgi:hypothetical protein